MPGARIVLAEAESMMRRVVPDILVRHEPGRDRAVAVPVVFDSPHSGSVYPSDFDFAAPLDIMRRAEDAFVDELFASAPAHGAALLAALFPRSYVDPNRHEHEIDTLLLNEPWPHPIVASHAAPAVSASCAAWFAPPSRFTIGGLACPRCSRASPAITGPIMMNWAR